MRLLPTLLVASGLFTSTYSYAGPINDRAQELLPWVAKQTGYSDAYVKITIIYKTPESLKTLVYGAHSRKTRDIHAATINSTIFLADWFTLGVHDQYIVHELVHVLQNANGAKFPCREVMEWEAYRVENEFVTEFGTGERIHEAYLYLLSHCPNIYGLP